MTIVSQSVCEVPTQLYVQKQVGRFSIWVWQRTSISVALLPCRCPSNLSSGHSAGLVVGGKNWIDITNFRRTTSWGNFTSNIINSPTSPEKYRRTYLVKRKSSFVCSVWQLLLHNTSTGPEPKPPNYSGAVSTGHGGTCPHFYKWLGTWGEGTPWLEQQTRNWQNCTDHHESAHKRTNWTCRVKKVEAPTFKFVPAPLPTYYCGRHYNCG